jgi:N-acetylneuraminate synthase
MIDILLSEYKGDIHISLGMTSQDERDEIARYLSPYKDRIVAYLCTSQYPTPFENVHLLELLKMKDIYKTLGYSGHGYGIATPVISYVLGCTYVESHFVYDRTAPFTDASSSLEPDGLRRLCRDLRNIQKTLTFKPYDISKEELHQAKKLRYYEKI